MQRFQALQTALSISEDEIQTLWAGYLDDAGELANEEDFLEWLHEQGALSAELYQQLATGQTSGTLANPARTAAESADNPAAPSITATPAESPAETPGSNAAPGKVASPYDDDDEPEVEKAANITRFASFTGSATEAPTLKPPAYQPPEAKPTPEASKSSPELPKTAPKPPPAATQMMAPPPPNVRTANPSPVRDTSPAGKSMASHKPGTGEQPKVAAKTGGGTGNTAAKTGGGSTGAKTGSQGSKTGSQAPKAPASKTGSAVNRQPTPMDTPKSRTPSLPPGSRSPEGTSTEAGTPLDIPGRGYKFVGKIGEGAMGEILVAKDLDLHRSVAYKVMSEAIAEAPELAGKFFGEAQITAQLDHPNIVPVYALARHPNGTLSYTMKQIRGKTFEKLIDESKAAHKARKVPMSLSLETRLDMFLKVLDAMFYAHTRGVVHRDLKPENIMVGAFGEVYVMDWGIARLFEVPGAKREDLVLVEGYQEHEGPPPGEVDDDEDDEIEGVIIGTPQYMSPEQAFGKRDLGGKSDQYALGLILYELVSLRQAVTGKSAQKIVLRQQDAEKEPLQHAFGEAIAPELRAIIEKSTQKKPESRYEDVRELGEDIRRFLRGEAVHAKRDTMRQAISRWVGRHRELTLATMFAFFTLSAFTVFASVGYQLYSTAQARAHEQAVTQLLTGTGAQAALIDSYFARYEGHLGIIAASTVEMLIRGEPTQQELYFAADYDDATKAPPDLTPSKRFEKPISVEYPVFAVSTGGDVEKVRPTFQKLTPVQRYLKRSLLLSYSEEASSYTPKKAERLIRDIGTPLVWAAIGLENGGFIGYPGHGGFPDKFDVKARPWYKLASGKREATWGSPYIDEFGIGRLLPCSMSLYDEDENFLGVASVQLPFEYIIDELLVTNDLPTGAESFLVDDTGKIIVRSSEKGKDGGQARNRALRLADFPVPEVVTAIKNKDSGKQEADVEGVQNLVLYNRMNTLGWYYVVMGPESTLLRQ